MQHAVVELLGPHGVFDQGDGQVAATRLRLHTAIGQAVAGVARRLGAHILFPHGALNQQPRGDLHQPRGQLHALARIGQGRRPRQQARILASVAIQIGGGLLDQLHAFAEGALEQLGAREVQHFGADKARRARFSFDGGHRRISTNLMHSLAAIVMPRKPVRREGAAETVPNPRASAEVEQRIGGAAL